MHSHCEITIVLNGDIGLVMSEVQEVFDAVSLLNPKVFESVNFRYFNMEE